MEQSSLMTNIDLYVILKQSGKLSNFRVLLDKVVSELNLNLSDEDLDVLKEFCRRFSQAVIKRWKQANSNSKTFREQYENWLALTIDWPTCVKDIQKHFDEASETINDPQPSTSSSVATSTSTFSSRRPFTDLGSKQKKRRISELENRDSNELAFAAISKLKKDGEQDFAAVIEHLIKNREDAARILETIKTGKNKSIIFTPDKALGLVLSLKLSKWQYITLRESSIRE